MRLRSSAGRVPSGELSMAAIMVGGGGGNVVAATFGLGLEKAEEVASSGPLSEADA